MLLPEVPHNEVVFGQHNTCEAIFFNKVKITFILKIDNVQTKYHTVR